jgi:class 3 adenylate cyclase
MTYEALFYGWVAEVSLMLTDGVDMVDPVSIDVASHYYFEIDDRMFEWLDIVVAKGTVSTRITAIFSILCLMIYTITTLFLVLFMIRQVHKADSPYRQTVQLLRHLPEESLPRDTLRILSGQSWGFRVNASSADSGSYDNIVDNLPNPVIIIDAARTILFCNKAALILVDSKDHEVVGQRLFDVMVMELRQTCTQGEGFDLEYLVNEYLFDDRSAVGSYELTGKKDHKLLWFSLTVLPVFDESPDQLPTKRHGADTFALIFHDTSEQVRKQNLYTQENNRYMDMLRQILPPQIADRLIAGETLIPLEVNLVAIAFCDIVSFTPWCAATEPKIVVETLNRMFTKFDECRAKYPQVTKIKCIGDCYMSAAGVFLPNGDPDKPSDPEPPRQMLRFCLDCIDSMASVNRAVDQTREVRIGIHYGGPIRAGVIGKHKPVFDIWGEAVSKAEHMESGGQPMKVHISPETYAQVRTEPFDFEVNADDGTALVKRVRDSTSMGSRLRRVSHVRRG